MTAVRTRRGLAAASALTLLVTLLATAPAARAQTAPAESSPEQQSLVRSLRQSSDGPVTVDRDPVTGAVTFVGTEAGTPLTGAPESGGAPEAAANGFVGRFGALFGTTAPGELRPDGTTESADGGAAVHYQQVEAGVPVLGGELTVQVDPTGEVRSALGELSPRLDVATEPTVGASDAAATAVEATAKARGVEAAGLTAAEPETWVYDPTLLGAPAVGGPRLVWRTEVVGPDGGPPVRELVLVDATTGGVALHFDQIAHGLDRSVCDFENVPNADETCVTNFVRSEGDPATGDPDTDNAYDYAGETYDFFSTRFGRDSIDDAGMPLISAVDYCPSASECPFENAFWNGSQMTYGDGFASADDVVAHELTHGITEHTSGLFYYAQSGAINESMSDVFGEYVDLTDGVGNDSPDKRWEMGEDLPVIGTIRDMADPTTFGDPDRMTSPNYTADESPVLSDARGVHTNSGVNNKAAFLLADGGSFNGRTVTALGITKAARIYYEVETTMLNSASDYADLGRALVQACTNSVGVDGITSGDCTEVQDAVDATEMLTPPTNAPTMEAPTGCAQGQVQTTLFSDDLENTASGNWSLTGSGAWAYPQNPNIFAGFDATFATSGDTNFFGGDASVPSDSFISRTSSITLPAGASLVFAHAFDLERNFDGGRVEYSTNGGSTWTSAGPLFSGGGYNGTISSGTISAFSGTNFGYGTSRVNLSSLAGQSFRFRFRLTTDVSVGWYGWFIDDVRLITCQAPTARPDGHIRLGATGAFVGDDVYNTTAVGQTSATTVRAGGTATFTARFENDGNITEPLRVSGPASTTAYRITYLAGTTDVTSAVVAGTYQTPALAPGARSNLKVVIKARAGIAVGTKVKAKLTVASTTNGSLTDAVKAKVTRT